MVELLTLLVLIIVANGSPILARHVPGLGKFARPLDADKLFADGRRWLGASKTWRGLLAACCCTVLAATALGEPWDVGLLVALLAMAGDICSSFLKRRLGRPAGAMALGLDQVPEALLPALYWQVYAGLSWLEVLTVVVLFFLLELLLSRWLYYLKIRRHPY